MSMKLSRSLASLLVGATFLAGACGRGGDADGAGFETTNEEIPMKVWVTLRGDREVTVRERTVLARFVRLGEGSGVEGLRPMLGVQPEEPILEGNVRVLPGLAIVPFDGNGKYTIEAGAPSDDNKGADPAAAAGVVTSSVRVEWWPVDGEPYEYLRRAKPCTAEVEDNGMRGRLRCPDITHEAPGGPHFSFEFRWEKA